MAGIRLIERAEGHGEAPAIASRELGLSCADLLDASARVGAALLEGEGDLREGRVAFLIPGSAEYAAVQWGVWRAGGIAVPLSVAAPEPELEHVLSDAGVGVALAPRRLMNRIDPLCNRLGIGTLSVEVRAEGDGEAGAG